MNMVQRGARKLVVETVATKICGFVGIVSPKKGCYSMLKYGNIKN